MNWLYIAGFFDGEGSLSHNGKGFRVTIAQTDLDVLTQIRNFADMGYVIKVKKRKKHWKDSWVYYIAKQEDVYYFLSSIKSHVIVKGSLIEKRLPEIKEAVQNINERRENRKYLISETKKLRKKGLTYRAIGKKLNIDYGYARRLII